MSGPEFGQFREIFAQISCHSRRYRHIVPPARGRHVSGDRGRAWRDFGASGGSCGNAACEADGCTGEPSCRPAGSSVAFSAAPSLRSTGAGRLSPRAGSISRPVRHPPDSGSRHRDTGVVRPPAPWNRAGGRFVEARIVSTPRATDFRTALHARFEEATKAGREFVEVNSGDLHREVGGYPARDGNHRIRTCCVVMIGEKTHRDRITALPPSGWGASLSIRYRLPRREGP